MAPPHPHLHRHLHTRIGPIAKHPLQTFSRANLPLCHFSEEAWLQKSMHQAWNHYPLSIIARRNSWRTKCTHWPDQLQLGCSPHRAYPPFCVATSCRFHSSQPSLGRQRLMTRVSRQRKRMTKKPGQITSCWLLWCFTASASGPVLSLWDVADRFCA